MNIAEKIGNRLKEVRTKSKISQTDLAKKLNVSRTGLSNWEAGRRLPKPNEIIKIAKILGVSPAYLYDLSENYRQYDTQKGTLLLIPAIQQASIKSIYSIKEMMDRIEEPDLKILDQYDFVPVMQTKNINHESFAVITADPAMSPDIFVNDIAIVTPSVKPSPGNFVLAFLKESSKVVIRRYTLPTIGEFELAPSNQDWPTYKESPSIKIIGTIVELRRNT